MDLDAKTFLSIELLILIVIVVILFNSPYKKIPHHINVIVIITVISAFIIHFIRMYQRLEENDILNNIKIILPYIFIFLLLPYTNNTTKILIFIVLGIYQYFTYYYYAKVNNIPIDMSHYYIIMFPITSVITYYGFKNDIFLLKLFLIDTVFHSLRIVNELFLKNKKT